MRLARRRIEYSLIERTVDGELLPWSPLRGGALTGKCTRENASLADPGRGARVTEYLTEPTFAIPDELQKVVE